MRVLIELFHAELKNSLIKIIVESVLLRIIFKTRILSFLEVLAQRDTQSWINISYKNEKNLPNTV
jgi:hypothetical protein